MAKEPSKAKEKATTTNSPSRAKEKEKETTKARAKEKERASVESQGQLLQEVHATVAVGMDMLLHSALQRVSRLQ